MKDKDIVYLEITSLSGISIGATHYYGKFIGYIDGEYTHKDITKIMTEKDAEILRKKDDWKYYKAGSHTERFETKEEIRERALLCWKEYFPEASVLLEGNSCVAEPLKCLWVKDAKLLLKLNKIWEESEHCPNTYAGSDKRFALYKKFMKVLEKECK